MKKNMLLSSAVLSLLFLTAAMNAQTVRINEVYSRGVAGDLDWIEVYNPSAASVNIGGYKIYDNGAQSGVKGKKLFPAGTIVPAKGFAAIVVDTATFVGDTTGFGLSSSGETVWLENAAGVLIDTCVIPALGNDTSYARVPDGALVWAKTTPRSKAKSNVFIKMNEIYTRGVAGNLDWVEIHNASSAAIDISGYKIYDNGAQSGVKGKKLFPVGTTVAANGFAVIVVDTATFVGDTTGFGLSSSGETIWLENAAGLIIDTVAIPALGNDTSYARVPDGSNLFVKKTPVTKGATNGTGTFVRSEPLAATDFALYQNYPNPFNPSTVIGYQLSSSNFVSIRVYDLLGKTVASLVNERKNAGQYFVEFDAAKLAGGVYLYSMQAGNYRVTKKMILVK
ncbi:MAG: lamin tail domain-containing protein [Bacteroidota bacterium]